MSRRILLVDESAMLRRIVASILQGQTGGYETVTATRPIEGFAVACTNRIDLLFMECRTGDPTGLEICQRLLRDPRTSGLPVVLLVNRGLDLTRHSSLPGNVVDTLIKPFAPEEVAGLVHAIFDFTHAGLTLAELRDSLRGRASISSTPPQDRGAADRAVGPALPGHAEPRFTRQPELTSTDGGTIYAISGETNLTSLRDVMHANADTGLTGTLRFRTGKGVHTEILFDEGHLLVVSTRDHQDLAAQAAQAVSPRVSTATLEEAISEQQVTGVPFLLTLGARGLLSKAAAVALLDESGQRQFAKLWTYRHRPSLRYEFEALEALPSYALRLAPIHISLDDWLLETTRRLRPEDIVSLRQHEGAVGTPLFQPDGGSVARTLPLTEHERAFLQHVSPRRDLPAIARELETTPESAYLTMHRLRCMEILHYRTAPAAFVMTPRTFSRRILPLER